jgi:hypothetical protein
MRPTTFDINRTTFNGKLRALGFRQVTGSIWRLPVPCSGQKVDEIEGGATLRERLAWMIGRNDAAIAAYLAGGDK